MKTSFIHTLFIFLLLALSTACDSGYADGTSSYEDAKLTLEQQENLYPLSFITTDGTYRKNLIGEWVMEGSVTSTAAVANYKDVVLTINYYSKTNTLIGSEHHTLYEYLTPGNSLKYKIKSYGYRGTSSVGIEIEDAIAAD